MTKNIGSETSEKKIKDSYERRINYLRVSITDRCNLRCFYCMPEKGISQIPHKDILRYEEILRIIRIAVANGIDKVRITGGEPLVRKGVVDFIKDVSSIKGIKDLSLTTNGVLLEDMAKDLYDAGLKRINISIDSMREETYKKITRQNYLKKVIDGLKKAYEVGFAPIKINAVIVRDLNDDEVVDFAKITEAYPFSVRFIEYMSIGSGNNWEEKLFVSSEEIKDKIGKYSKLIPIPKTEISSPATNFKMEGAKGSIGFISPMSRHFCELCNRLRLTADGKIRSCLFSDVEIDLKDSLRSDENDDSEISKIIRQAILKKPEGHEKLNEHGDKKRSMYSIGG